MMLTPALAPVRPRVLLHERGEPARLEGQIQALRTRVRRGAVCLTGGPGAGKTVALAHLAAILGGAAGVTFLDEPDEPMVQRAAEGGLVVYAARRPLGLDHVATYRLREWDSDDWIEYLLSVHKSQCASVMARLREAAVHDVPGGLPEICTIVLDELAADESLPDAASALRRHLERQISEPAAWRRAWRLALELQLGRLGLAAVVDWRFLRRLDENGARLITFPAVRSVLALDGAVADLRAHRSCRWLRAKLPPAFVADIGAVLRDDQPVLARLAGLFAQRDEHTQPSVVALLVAGAPNWKPPAGQVVSLSGAHLPRVEWAGVDLKRADIADANLQGADLSEADLTGANACGTRFRGACLHGALLTECAATGADFSGADLSFVRATKACLSATKLVGANLEGALLEGALLIRADLSGASLVRANLAGARLYEAGLTHAEFAGANLGRAALNGLDLSLAGFVGARFAQAQLAKCNLEGMRLPAGDFTQANLRGAYLTGSYIPAGCFENADLSGAGLADIDWERANLRRADLTGATFHMGSSRSGLVFSPFASEGTRTGFYTDEYGEQSYRAPEDIRKANLRGADLRGARIEGVDFYLVDVREALYDLHQAEHLRRCGAILETRV